MDGMNPQNSTPASPPDSPANAPVSGAAPPAAGGLTEEQIWVVLRECYDPEIPVNIVDLGLVYDVAIAGNRVDVKMTLTAPGCHLGGMIAGDVQNKLMALEGVVEANVELVWDPPWHQSMITAEGRKALGME
jgi:metal-sulfur cluster biosynthetic enzyme